MCGIAGIVSTNRFDVQEIMRMTSLVRHRGPDDEGYMLLLSQDSDPVCYGGSDTPDKVYQSLASYAPTRPITSVETSRAFLGFGHRRLAIIDLSPQGHMPLCDPNMDYYIIYNGEIYNYLEIKEELVGYGYHFSTKTDTEVLLAAYDKWGVACQNRFIGMWALAIYDVRNKTLFISRDRFGIKPLYYWFAPRGKFCFASEIKQFTAVKGWTSRLNTQRAADYLYHSLTDHTDETLFEGVYQLPAGHYLLERVDCIRPDRSGRSDLKKWYSPDQSSSNLTFQESVEVFRDIFTDAIKIHLRSDVPVGSALSGGLDSSSIVCLVNQLLNIEGKSMAQKTFSSESHIEYYSERRWMDIVVDALKLDAHFVYPGPERWDELTRHIIWHHDEPYQSQQTYLAYHVFEMARKQNISVMLNGHGSDEYLSAYGGFYKYRWRQYAKKRQYAALRREFAHYRVHSIMEKMRYYFDPFLGNTLDVFRHWYMKHRSIKRFLLHIIDDKKMGVDYLHSGVLHPHGQESIPQIVKNNLYHSPSPKYLKYEDRNSMAHSIEARVPFMDHRLIEFCSSLPVGYLNGMGETKKILVHAMNGILPEEVRNRKDKIGFLTPEKRWVVTERPAFFRQQLKEAIEISDGLIKPSALLFFDKMVAGKTPYDYGYLRLILFATWLKEFNVVLSGTRQ